MKKLMFISFLLLIGCQNAPRPFVSSKDRELKIERLVVEHRLMQERLYLLNEERGLSRLDAIAKVDDLNEKYWADYQKFKAGNKIGIDGWIRFLFTQADLIYQCL